MAKELDGDFIQYKAKKHFKPKGITNVQTHLAMLFGVSQTQISFAFSGKKPELLKKIAELIKK
jgi:hypothetical protein